MCMIEINLLFSVYYEIQLICFEKAQEFCIETTELWVETV